VLQSRRFFPIFLSLSVFATGTPASRSTFEEPVGTIVRDRRRILEGVS
jgi:hypothetical protein